MPRATRAERSATWNSHMQVYERSSHGTGGLKPDRTRSVNMGEDRRPFQGCLGVWTKLPVRHSLPRSARSAQASEADSEQEDTPSDRQLGCAVDALGLVAHRPPRLRRVIALAGRGV